MTENELRQKVCDKARSWLGRKEADGSHREIIDVYMTGDKVHYPDAEGPVYVSTVDNNVWAPDVYGWSVI